MQSVPSKKPEDQKGRVESHGMGVGGPTPDAVEMRAREIAVINGRSGDKVTEDDRVRAMHELQNKTIELSSDNARSDRHSSSNPADMVTETGHQAAEKRPADEQMIVEKGIKEGVREAEHERMVKGQQIEQDTGDSDQA